MVDYLSLWEGITDKRKCNDEDGGKTGYLRLFDTENCQDWIDNVGI